MKRLCGLLFSAVIFFILLVGCESLFGDLAQTDTSGQVLLTEGDFAEEPPCSNRDTLPSDATFLAVLSDATELIHSHKEYRNDSNLPAVCGLAAADHVLDEDEIGWDPAAGNDINVCNSFDDSLPNFVAATDYYPGMCRSNFAFSSEATDDGFPRGGTYRVDVCIGSGEESYNIRLRIAVSGDDVNKTWASADVEDVDSLEVFNEDGTQLTTPEEIKSLLIDNPGGIILTVRSAEGLTTHLTIDVQIICIDGTASCPTPDEACN